MKRFFIFLILIMLCFSLSAHAQEYYISIDPYPYSTHVLGEDLVIYGDTNIPFVLLSLFFPDDEQNYQGMVKLSVTVTSEELRNGYVIGTEKRGRQWPTGQWRIVVSNKGVLDSIMIPMAEEALYNRKIYLSEYENGTLTNTESYTVRGMSFKDNIISFTSQDGEQVKIFSWNNLSPTNNGESRVFIAYYQNGYVACVKSYKGYIDHYNYSISLEGEPGKKFKLLYWGENLNPVK